MKIMKIMKITGKYIFYRNWYKVIIKNNTGIKPLIWLRGEICLYIINKLYISNDISKLLLFILIILNYALLKILIISWIKYW